MNDSLSKAWLQYEAGKDYKRRIGLYHTARQNERFYRGDQWHMVESGNLPRPVFNVVKRVVDYLVCSVVPGRVEISYSDENTPFLKEDTDSKRICAVLTDNARYRWERSKMDSALYRVALDAAIRVEDASTYNSSVAISILDKLLDKGLITLKQYLGGVADLNLSDGLNFLGGVNDE